MARVTGLGTKRKGARQVRAGDSEEARRRADVENAKKREKRAKAKNQSLQLKVTHHRLELAQSQKNHAKQLRQREKEITILRRQLAKQKSRNSKALAGTQKTKYQKLLKRARQSKWWQKQKYETQLSTWRTRCARLTTKNEELCELVHHLENVLACPSSTVGLNSRRVGGLLG